jgi:Insulinase (Peptidase family M16)
VKRVTDQLETPSVDDRSYRVVRLANQLEVLLVHDAETDKASAAMDVNVGSFSDPEDMAGMGHAVEHLLFMGTKKVALFSPHVLRSTELTHVVSDRKRVLSIPFGTFGKFECIHCLNLHELLLRSRGKVSRRLNGSVTLVWCPGSLCSVLH